MKEELRSAKKPAFEVVRLSKSAVVAAANLPAEGLSRKCEKSGKPIFAVFQLEPAIAQAVPTKTRVGHFSDFSKNSRGYTGGRGSKNPNLNRVVILVRRTASQSVAVMSGKAWERPGKG
jgi:hypothetical protein